MSNNDSSTTAVEPPSRDNLAVCNEHGVMTHSRNDRRRCPLCNIDLDVEVRRGEEAPGSRKLTQQEIRQRIDAETMEELLPLMAEYLDDRVDGEPEMWISVVGLDGALPAGYTEAQERWVNIVAYEWGSRVKAVSQDHSALATIETLRENGYGDE